MPVKKTTKKATKKAKPKATKKPARTESKTKQGRKVKAGQAYECSVCGFRLVVDACGGVEEHYLICCQEAMKQKKPKPATK